MLVVQIVIGVVLRRSNGSMRMMWFGFIIDSIKYVSS